MSKEQERKFKAAAVKGQLLRWFHERGVRELKAMRAAFEQSQQPNTQKDTNK